MTAVQELTFLRHNAMLTKVLKGFLTQWTHPNNKDKWLELATLVQLIRFGPVKLVQYLEKIAAFYTAVKVHQISLHTVVLIIFFLLITACHPKSNADINALRFSPCTPPKSQALIPESECAYITVHENTADDQSTQIYIHFLRIKAVVAKPESDPLVLIQGGPGGSSQTMAYSLYRYFTTVRQKRDLLFVDLRGTGESNPLNCSGLETITAELSDKEALQRYHTLMANCARQYNSNSRFYTTSYAVADLEQVRTRLGYRQFNLWGASYGSRVALEYAATFPNSTRSLVLDGLAPKAISLPRFIAHDATAAFAQLNLDCQNDSICREHYGDLTVQAEKVISALQRAETEQVPIQVTLPDPLNQQPKHWKFTPRRFAQLVISTLYSRELTSLAPRALKEAAEGNFQLLATINALAEASNEQLSIAEGLYYSVICNEDLAVAQGDEGTDTHFMGVDLVEDKVAVCADWPKAINSISESAPVNVNNSSAVPTLLLSGALDPVTPKRWADQVALSHPHHQSILVPGGNHVVSTLGCIPNLIAQFMLTPNTPLPVDCASKISHLPFYLGADQAAVKTPATSDSSQASHD